MSLGPSLHWSRRARNVLPPITQAPYSAVGCYLPCTSLWGQWVQTSGPAQLLNPSPAELARFLLAFGPHHQKAKGLIASLGPLPSTFHPPLVLCGSWPSSGFDHTPSSPRHSAQVHAGSSPGFCPGCDKRSRLDVALTEQSVIQRASTPRGIFLFDPMGNTQEKFLVFLLAHAPLQATSTLQAIRSLVSGSSQSS